MKLLIRLLPFLLLGWLIFSYYKRYRKLMRGTRPSNLKNVSDTIFLKTISAHTYTLVDKDGLDLVFGHVIQLGMSNDTPKKLYVHYKHEQNKQKLYAEIDTSDLSTRNITKEMVPVELKDPQDY